MLWPSVTSCYQLVLLVVVSNMGTSSMIICIHLVTSKWRCTSNWITSSFLIGLQFICKMTSWQPESSIVKICVTDTVSSSAQIDSGHVQKLDASFLQTFSNLFNSDCSQLASHRVTLWKHDHSQVELHAQPLGNQLVTEAAQLVWLLGNNKFFLFAKAWPSNFLF